MKKLSVAIGAICIASAPAYAVIGLGAPTGEAGERNPETTAGKQVLGQEYRSSPGSSSPNQMVIDRSGRRISGKPPRLVRGITNRHYPREIQRRWPAGGAIFVRVLIQPNGRAAECEVMRSFGDPEADRATCSLIKEQGKFRPAVNERGEPVAAWYGYVQMTTGRFSN